VYSLGSAFQTTVELATERTTLDFELRQDKIKRARETGRDSVISGRRLQCVPEGKHKTRQSHAPANSSILISNQSS